MASMKWVESESGMDIASWRVARPYRQRMAILFQNDLR